MANTALSPHPITRTAVRLDPHSMTLGAASVALLVGALYVPMPAVGLTVLAVGMVLLAGALGVRMLAHRYRSAREVLHETIASFVDLDGTPSFTTDAKGRSAIATVPRRTASAEGGETLVRALGDCFASPGAVLYRLQSKAQGKGFAREDVVMRRG